MKIEDLSGRKVPKTWVRNRKIHILQAIKDLEKMGHEDRKKFVLAHGPNYIPEGRELDGPEMFALAARIAVENGFPDKFLH